MSCGADYQLILTIEFVYLELCIILLLRVQSLKLNNVLAISFISLIIADLSAS